MSTMRAAITEALAGVIEGVILDGQHLQAVVDQMTIDLTPFEDDGNTQADTYLLSVYLDAADLWSPRVRLLELINDQLDAITARNDPSYALGGRAGYDKALEGFAAELAECLAVVEQALRVERAMGIANGDWEGSVEAEG